MTAEVPMEDVKKLRESTGAGIMDCKRALVEAGGDIEKATDLLRTWGVAGAAKRASRGATEGRVEAYIHQPNPDFAPKVGVLVELDCETDFVAKSEEFGALARQVAMHIAWAQPRWISKDEVSQDVLDRERSILLDSDIAQGKKPEVVEKIVEGKLSAMFKEPGGALLDQIFWKDEAKKQTVGNLITDYASLVKENVVVRRFARFKVGEE